MSVKLPTEHNLEFLSLKGGCTGSSESTHVKMPHCWKSHVSPHLLFIDHICRTVGMGELNVVLNGIEFRTRHNDYRLRMPSKTKKDYNLMEYIDFPPVPPAVMNKKTVHEQVLEMREWFRGTKITTCGSRGGGAGGPDPPGKSQ